MTLPLADTSPARGVWLFPDADAAMLVRAVVEAERVGLDEVWLGDEGPARDPMVVLAAASLVTERIRLGIAITNPYLRHPASTAAAAVTLQELSGGRFALGLGAGGGMALAPVGVERNEPVRRLREAIEITRAVAARRRSPGYEPPAHAVPPTPLPVLVGARGERLNRLASEVADGVFVGGVPLTAVPTVVGWATSIRSIDVVLSAPIALDEAAFEQLRPALLWSLGDAPAEFAGIVGVDPDDVTHAVRSLIAGDDAPARTLIDDELASQLAIRGAGHAASTAVADLVSSHHPSSIVLNLHASSDPVDAVTAAADVLTTGVDLHRTRMEAPA